MVGGLLDVPAEAQPEREPAAGEMVERGDLLGQGDRVVLGDERDARAEPEPLGDGGGLAEGHERVEGAPVLGRQITARRVRGGPLDGDVGVLGQIQPGESAVLQLPGQPGRGDRLVGEEDRHGDAHDASLPERGSPVHTDRSGLRSTAASAAPPIPALAPATAGPRPPRRGRCDGRADGWRARGAEGTRGEGARCGRDAG